MDDGELRSAFAAVGTVIALQSPLLGALQRSLKDAYGLLELAKPGLIEAFEELRLVTFHQLEDQGLNPLPLACGRLVGGRLRFG